MWRPVWSLVLIFCFLSSVSSDYQEHDKDPILSYAGLESPFRSQKCNLLWNKARTKLHEGKLKLLYSEMKLHDKEQMALKKLKSEGMDKDGLREAEVRKKFNGIMFEFSLAGAPPAEDFNTNSKSKALFKDKKLERLWEKAQKSGLSDEELLLLKKEFQHHQEKLEEYHRLKELAMQSSDGNMKSNDIDAKLQLLMDEEGDEGPEIDMNSLSGKSKALKDDYDRLHRLSVNSVPAEFSEPKVRGLWRLAQEADFNSEELESLRQELHHYEKRIEKLHHLDAELKLVDSRHGGDIDEKTDGRKKMDRKLAKHEDTVKKMHADLASKIAARHSEL